MSRGTNSSIVAFACSALATGALIALGLHVPSEDMVRATPSVVETAPALVDADADAGAVPVGPSPIEVAGPRSPSVPALALRSASPTEPAAEVAALPARLRVPALDIDALIVGAGVDARGEFEVPDPREVGWYVHGPVPGDEGAAVLAGHVDLAHVAGVFFHLDDVLVGDRIYVDFDDGSSREFEVVDDVLYDKTALPEAELFRRTGAPVLQLVTCGGLFDPERRHYLGNRVVTARLLEGGL